MADVSNLLTTWDGLFISEEPPHGASVIVSCRTGGEIRYLLLHRRGVAGDGAWAWGPPAGARLPGEPVEACAARELEEETGLSAALRAVAPTTDTWALFTTDVEPGVSIVLSDEHDRFEWVTQDEAVRRCQPAAVGETFRAVA